MIVPLSKEAQHVLGMPELVIITERVDDVALLIAQMIRMGLPQVYPSTWLPTQTELGLDGDHLVGLPIN